MNKHFLLGAGFALTVAFAASSTFAQFMPQGGGGGLMKCLNLGGKMTTVAECQAADAGSSVRWCAPGETPQTGPTGEATCKLTPLDSAQQPAQSSISQPVQQTTTPTQQNSDISELKKMLEEMKAGDKNKKEQAEKEEQDDLLGEMKKILEQSLLPEEEISVDKKVNKSKLSSAKNPAATLAKKGLRNVDKLLNTLSKKFNKEKSKLKKIAVVRSIAKDFMKLCTKYASDVDEEEFDDEESFTCDEFVADLSEPIAAALKSKDADLAFELTYDALTVNFKELFNSLIQ